jgi:hypothetical protein
MKKVHKSISFRQSSTADDHSHALAHQFGATTDIGRRQPRIERQTRCHYAKFRVKTCRHCPKILADKPIAIFDAILRPSSMAKDDRQPKVHRKPQKVKRNRSSKTNLMDFSVPGCGTIAGRATLHRQESKADRVPSQFSAENHGNPHKVNGKPPNVCSFCQNVHRVHSNPNREVGAARPNCNLPPPIQFDVAVGALVSKSRPLQPVQPFRANSLAWYEYPPIQSNKVVGVATAQM